MMIYVVNDFEQIELPVEKSWSIYELKRQIRSTLRVPFHQQELFFRKPILGWWFKFICQNIPLDDNQKTLEDYDILYHSQILIRQTNVPTRINVIDAETNFYCEFDDEPLPKIIHLKEKISQRINLPVEQILLTFQNKELGGDLISCPHLFNQGVEHESSVNLVRLRAKIFVKFVDYKGNAFTAFFWLTETIEGLKEVIQREFSIPLKNQKLMFQGKRLRVGTLNYNQLKTNSTVDVYSHSDCTQIFVKPLNKTTKTILDIELSATVEELKARIQSLLAIPIDQQRLVYDGKHLEDRIELFNYGVKLHDTVHVVLRFRGC